MCKKVFKKLRLSSKQWFLRVVWSHVRTHKALSLTFLILVVVILVCITSWSCMVKHAQLTAGFLTSLVLAIGLYFAYRQLKVIYENNRLIKTTEQAKLINEMSEYWNSQVMRKGRKALWEITTASTTALCDAFKRCDEQHNFERRLELTTVGDFFENMGNLAHQKALDLPIIAGYFRTQILHYYENYEPYIKEKRQTQPSIYEHLEWLAKEIQKVKSGG